jgi:APA family basic amino acid/polyamine antiporter
MVRLILAISLVGLLQVFNGNFVASTRLLFAFGRRGTIPAQFAAVHAKYLTPTAAIVGISTATIIGLLIGDALLVPVTEVGSMAAALGWLAACASFCVIEKSPRLRAIAAFGAVVSLLLVVMKLVPVFPGHFSVAEWLALAAWLGLGLLFHRQPRSNELRQKNGAEVTG